MESKKSKKMTGCYGQVSEYFIKRREMPSDCDDNRCFQMDACFRASFKTLTGIEPENGFSYVTRAPKWRGG